MKFAKWKIVLTKDGKYGVILSVNRRNGTLEVNFDNKKNLYTNNKLSRCSAVC